MPETDGQLERGRFEGEVLARLAALNQKLDGIIGGQNDHENRLRRIEEYNAKTKGVSAAVAALISTGISVLGIAVEYLRHV